MSNENTHDLAEMLQRFAKEAPQAEVTQSKERLVGREIPFGTVQMNAPESLFSFRLREDDEGAYVEVSFGFGSGHHYTSSPVVLRDRRPEMVNVAREHREELEQKAQLRRRQQLEQYLELAQQQLRDNESLGRVSEQLIPYYESLLTQVNARLGRAEEGEAASGIWREDEKAELNSLRAAREEIEQILRRLDPINLECKISALSHSTTSLASQLENTTEVNILESTGVPVDQQLREKFIALGGVVREVTVTESIGQTQTDFLEIVETAHGAPGGGIMEFSAREIRLPKMAFPADLALLVHLGNIFTTEGFPLLGEDTIKEEVETQGGICRRVGYSSGTGRHQGFGYFIVRPGGE
ncbi:hypothetical protein KKB83_03570 [Patescibacteria group bacterium]|nr:hypothetical protein [Patescibacteria group bacterium]